LAQTKHQLEHDCPYGMKCPFVPQHHFLKDMDASRLLEVCCLSIVVNSPTYNKNCTKD
jgi:hypothetical protein